MTVTLEITDVAHGGYGVGRHEGVVVFVTGTLPGEVVEAEIVGRRSRVWYGRTVAIRTASPDRVPHVWPLAERTGVGGVDLGHVSLAGGRRWKAAVIATQFRRLAGQELAVTVEGVPADEARAGLAWRTRVSFAVADGRLAMRAAKSHDLVPVDGMPLAHEDIQAALAEDLRSTHDTVTYIRPSGSDLVRLTGHDPTEVREVVVTPTGTWRYEVAGGGFWQVHREAPRVLVEAVLAAVGDCPGPVMDLYAGAGLFTQPLAARATASRVVAVEAAPAGVALLRRNTDQVEVVAGDVATVLARRPVQPGGVIVCDPPRAGAGREVMTLLASHRPERIVYVACDPAALARDVAYAAGLGYVLSGLRAFDLFPLTHHVECVAVLTSQHQ